MKKSINMKKFVLTRTGEEVKIGDTIEGTKIVENSFGTIEVIHTIKIKQTSYYLFAFYY